MVRPLAARNKDRLMNFVEGEDPSGQCVQWRYFTI
jgi:hypothetical protein